MEKNSTNSSTRISKAIIPTVKYNFLAMDTLRNHRESENRFIQDNFNGYTWCVSRKGRTGAFKRVPGIGWLFATSNILKLGKTKSGVRGNYPKVAKFIL